jgi:hypothetical protein
MTRTSPRPRQEQERWTGVVDGACVAFTLSSHAPFPLPNPLQARPYQAPDTSWPGRPGSKRTPPLPCCLRWRAADHSGRARAPCSPLGDRCAPSRTDSFAGAGRSQTGTPQACVSTTRREPHTRGGSRVPGRGQASRSASAKGLCARRSACPQGVVWYGGGGRCHHPNLYAPGPGTPASAAGAPPTPATQAHRSVQSPPGHHHTFPTHTPRPDTDIASYVQSQHIADNTSQGSHRRGTQ